MQVARPSYRWQGIGLLRASTARPGLRTPDDLDITGPDGARGGAAWLVDLRIRPHVRAALEAASPDLLAALDILSPDDPDGLGGVDERRIRRLVNATVPYLLRWQHRATPFGLFAGVTAVDQGPEATVTWGGGHQIVRQVDGVWLADQVTRLHASTELLDRLTVVTSTVITQRGDRIVAPGPAPASGDEAPLEVSVRATQPVRTALDAARTPIRFHNLATILNDAFPAATPGQINGILTGLIGQQLLISNLTPPMTRPDALGHICRTLRDVGARDIPALAKLIDTLSALHNELISTRPLPDPNAPAALNGTGGERVPVSVDIVLDAQVSLPEQVGAEAARAASVLCRVTPYPFGTLPWRDYHSRFLARYGTDQPVPVLDLLGDGGLGYPAGYLGSGWGHTSHPFTARDEKLLALVQEATVEGRELVLTDALVEELADDRDATLAWPDRVEIGVQVHATSPQDINAGRFTLLVTATPRPGSSMTGRHAHLLPEEARAKLAATFTTTNQASIAAQLSFPPRHYRNAPLAVATPLVDHLIPIAEHPPDGCRAVAVNELAVVAEPDRFHLLDLPSGQGVEVRVAHPLEATAHIPPLARFLSEITTARAAFYTAFHFGAARQMPYLPRVRYRRTILSLARWLLPAATLPGPITPHDQWEDAFTWWRRRWAVPAHVTIVEHDRQLRLDLDLTLHRQLLRTRLNRKPRLELRENIGEYGWIGRAHEILLPLRLTPPPPALTEYWTGPATRSTAASPNRGLGLPGACEVVCARLTSHPARWDDLLTGYLPRLLDALSAQHWWFRRHQDLRHPDTDPYLALYFHLPAPDHYGTAATRLASWTTDLIRQNLAGTLTLDTYHPHPGRYGHGPALEAAHAVLAADSTAAITQITLAARTGLPATAVTAASMVDLATAFAGSPDDGVQWLLRDLPHQGGRLDPGLRDHALDLADPTGTWRCLATLRGGHDVITAWQQRSAALAAYRAALEQERNPLSVLPILLRGHHRRAQGIDGEQTTLRLARACALRYSHLTPR